MDIPLRKVLTCRAVLRCVPLLHLSPSCAAELISMRKVLTCCAALRCVVFYFRACSQAVLLSEKRGKERAAALAAKRAGKAAAKPKKSEAQKKVARDFYNQVCFVLHCYLCYLLVI
jgi:hypothetical protein